LRFSNAGQMCDGLKRLIVHRSRYSEVVDMLRKTLLSKKLEMHRMKILIFDHLYQDLKLNDLKSNIGMHLKNEQKYLLKFIFLMSAYELLLPQKFFEISHGI